MNEPQMPGNRAPMGQGQPAAPKWLWITLIVVLLIGGAFAAWYFLMGPGKAVESSTATTTTTPVDETADWKTYSNTTYNYSIKYPTTLAYAQAKTFDAATDAIKDATITFASDNTTKLTIISVAKTKYVGVTLDQFTTDYVTPKDKATITGKKATTIGTLSGFQESVKISDPASEGLWYFTESTDYFYVFVSEETTQTSDIKNMLSTFKFTAAASATSTADWKTYTSTADKFSVKYPKTWTYIDGKVANSDANYVTFNAASGDKWVFGLDIATTSKTLQQNADAFQATLTGKTVTPSNVTVGGQPAIKLTYTPTDAGGADIVVVNSGKLYTIHENTSSTTITDQTTALSTFQFTP